MAMTTAGRGEDGRAMMAQRERIDPVQRTASTDGRSRGALVGGSVAVIAALVGLAFGAPFLGLGIPAAVIGGWLVGPRVRAAGGVIGPALAMAVVTVAVADTLVVAVLAIVAAGGASTTSILNAFGASIFLWFAGLVTVGIPMLFITVPCGLVWSLMSRRLAREDARLEPSAP